MTTFPFVQDLRPDSDSSFSQLPQNPSFEQVQALFKFRIRRDLGEDRAQPGEKYWRLVGFYLRSGIASYIVKVRDSDSAPLANIAVFRSWEGAEPFPQPVDPPYFSHGVGGFTNADGDAGFPYAGGSAFGSEGGPDALWVAADPPGGLRRHSDAVTRLGWLGGSDHVTLNPIFQVATKDQTQPPGNGGSQPPVATDTVIELRVGGETVYSAPIQVQVTGVKVTVGGTDPPFEPPPNGGGNGGNDTPPPAPRSFKLGFHCNRMGGDVLQAIERVRPPVILALDHGVDFWRDVRALVPEAVIVGRLHADPQPFEDNPQARGIEFAERILRLELAQTSLITCWQGYNEVIFEDHPLERAGRYDDFMVAFAERLRQGGQEPAAFAFNTGHFQGTQVLDRFPGTLDTYTYLLAHEYDWPTMDRLETWLCLRYRRWMEPIREVYGDKHRLVISECGMTQGVHPEGNGDVGWLAEPIVSEESYWQSLEWYNNELARDDYVMGGCLFVVGSLPPWETFEHLGPMIDRLAEFRANREQAGLFRRFIKRMGWR